MCGKRAGVWEFFLQNVPCVSVSRNCAQPGGCAPFLPGWGGYMILFSLSTPLNCLQHSATKSWTMTSTSTGESDAEFLARMEAEDAAAFASAVAEWRAEREAGGGAARVVEFGGDFAADSEAAGDDGLEGVDAEWLAGDDEGEERRMQLIRNGGKRSSAEVEAAELEAANLPEQFALACVTVGQGDDGGDDAPSGRPPSDVWAAARCGSAAGLAPFLPAQCDALDATGLSPLYAYRALEP